MKVTQQTNKKSSRVTLDYEDLDWDVNIWLWRGWRLRLRFYIMRNPCFQFHLIGYSWLMGIRIELPPFGGAIEFSRWNAHV